MSFDRSAMTTLDLVKSATAGVGFNFTSVGFSIRVSINQGYRSVLANTRDGDIRTARKLRNVICETWTTIMSFIFETTTSFIPLTARDNGCHRNYWLLVKASSMLNSASSQAWACVYTLFPKFSLHPTPQARMTSSITVLGLDLDQMLLSLS